MSTVYQYTFPLLFSDKQDTYEFRFLIDYTSVEGEEDLAPSKEELLQFLEEKEEHDAQAFTYGGEWDECFQLVLEVYRNDGCIPRFFRGNEDSVPVMTEAGQRFILIERVHIHKLDVSGK